MKTKVKNSISSSGELLLYGDIGDYCDEMDALSVVSQLESIDSDNITVRIHSAGGLISEGLAIYNRLKESKAFITIHIDGIAASMASVVAMAGDKVVMPDNALMMIHKPWNLAVGDAEEMRKTADSLDVFEESILKIYTANTNLSKDELQDMLSDETWLSAEQAIEYGFADELSEPVKAAAKLDLSNFTKAPKSKINGVFSYEAKAASKQSKEIPMTKEVKKEAAENKAAEVKIEKHDVGVDAKVVAENAVATERKRAADIRSIGAKASLDDVQINQMIDDGVSVDNARMQALDSVSKRDAEFVPNNHISVTDRSDDAIKSITNALAHRALPGVIKLESGIDFKNSSLKSIAETTLNSRGISTRNMSKTDVFSTALNQSTSDFPLILADVSNKVLRNAYDAAPKTFEPFITTQSVSDFKDINNVQLGGIPTLEQVNENGEYTYTSLSESNESFSVATFGRIIPLTRQLMINDDLNALMRIPALLGSAAAELESTTIWGKFTANAAMSDGVALFHATHKNLGTAGVLSETTLAEARKKMRKQTGLDSIPMNLFGEYLIVPAALEVVAMKLLTSIQATATGDVNVFGGSLKLIVEPRLDASSETAWYISASPTRIDTITRAYLAGNEGVFLESEYGFDVDGMKVKARMDFGAGVLDYRGLYKNAGA